jgi:hypothetical protein
MRIFLLLPLAAAFLSSCCHERLHVQSEYLLPDRYASVYIGSPDPKKYFPDTGQRLMIQWKLKKEMKCYEEVVLKYKIILRNYERVEKSMHVRCPVGRIYYMLMNEDFRCTDGIMAYHVQVVADGCVIAEKFHHLYREVITAPPMPAGEEEPDEIYFDPIDDLDPEENPEL